MDDGEPGVRARQARQTRDDILQAARRLFAERGYARTTVREVAAAAAVSAQTVYDSVGSKAELVARLNDLIDEEAGVLAIVDEARASDDSMTLVGTPARIVRSIIEHCGDIVLTVATGAASEPDLAAVMDEGQRRHLAGCHRFAAALAVRGALAPGVDVAAAGDTMAALSDSRVALMLRDAYGWSPERIETWMVDATAAMVLHPPVP